jgi:hypothetical protein
VKTIRGIINLFFVALIVYFSLFWYNSLSRERALLQIIESLKAESRIAEVLVTQSKADPDTGMPRTTIKFLEYDVAARPLKPKYFTLDGNILHFKALVVRFGDVFVERRDAAKGKSICLFLNVFTLNKDKADVKEITTVYETPDGYRVRGVGSRFQNEIWRRFWDYALDPDFRGKVGIKNAQIEAPGMLFVPGTIYTIVVEHDGGLRIDTKPIPSILRGERIPQ